MKDIISMQPFIFSIFVETKERSTAMHYQRNVGDLAGMKRTLSLGTPLLGQPEADGYEYNFIKDDCSYGQWLG